MAGKMAKKSKRRPLGGSFDTDDRFGPFLQEIVKRTAKKEGPVTGVLVISMGQGDRGGVFVDVDTVLHDYADAVTRMTAQALWTVIENGLRDMAEALDGDPDDVQVTHPDAKVH